MRPPKKTEPDLMEQASQGVISGLQAAARGVRAGVEATGDAIRTTAEATGKAIRPMVVEALAQTQAGLEAAFPAAARERNYLTSDFDFTRPLPPESSLTDYSALTDAIVPPVRQSAAPGRDLTDTLRRDAGNPLQMRQGDWPAIADVKTITDLPLDNRVNDPRPSRAYLPYVESIVGANAEYMSLLLGKESPRDRLDEKNPNSSAIGPGQLIDATADLLFKRYASELGVPNADQIDRESRLDIVRNDRRWSVALSARYQIENADAFRTRYGKNPTWAQVREMHFFGDTLDFHRFNAAPADAIAINHVSAAARSANPYEFFETSRGSDGRWHPDYLRPRTVAEVKKRLHGGWPDREFTDRTPTKPGH